MLTGRIGGKYRILLLLAALLYVSAFFTPLWKISLDAPQYPEGLGMYIWINNVTGEATNDLQNINLLNHYIGMKVIESDSIPELVYMPWLLGALVFLGLIAFAYPARWFAFFVVMVTVLLGAAGLYDFFLWEYDYGHNLNPDAPIIIEGMSYQPPLIFCKQLLNILSCSMPHAGAISITLGSFLTALSIWKGKEGQNGSETE